MSIAEPYPKRMPDLPNSEFLPADFFPVLEEAVERAYEDSLGDANYILGNGAYDIDTVHMAPICHLTAAGVAANLRLAGYNAYNATVLEPIPGTSKHACTKVSFGDTEALMIDPTWQQFLPQPKQDAPRFLAGSPESIRDEAVFWGIDPRQAEALWPDTM